jgi:glycosyltransferase involved in cell wall biosynthesis
LPDRVRRIAIITRDAPPRHCGVGDHSICLADALSAEGADVCVLAYAGDASGRVATRSTPDAATWLQWIEGQIGAQHIDHVVLQYTPLYYRDIPGWSDAHFSAWWARLAARYAASIVVHETYHRSLRQPKSLVSGTRQKRTLQALAGASAHVFTASEPLVHEMAEWMLQRPAVLVPIGSNLAVAHDARSDQRLRYGIDAETLVLTLFGGGNSLKWMAGHVNAVSRTLADRGMPHRWLLLGGVPAEWFEFAAPAIAPGRLSPADLSAHLAVTDIFLVPHAAGVCAKRGTLMAAMQHGLAVVGTRGPMTDGFWERVPGVRVTPSDEGAFVAAVAEVAGDASLRAGMGSSNEQHYRAFFDWPHIARAVLAEIAPATTERLRTIDGPVTSI